MARYYPNRSMLRPEDIHYLQNHPAFEGASASEALRRLISDVRNGRPMDHYKVEGSGYTYDPAFEYDLKYGRGATPIGRSETTVVEPSEPYST